MKKFLYIIMAAATLMAVGCEKNIDTDLQEGEDQESSLTISLPTDTKITFDGTDGYKSSWVVGDQIRVQTSNGYSVYTCQSASGKQATFRGNGTPTEGGQVLYPGDSQQKYWYYSNSSRTYRYRFASEYIWDGTTINSVVPMVGKINGNKASLDYASGAILVEYSKITLTTAKLVVSFGNSKVTGGAALNGEQLNTPNSQTGSDVTIWMNAQHKMIGGTPTNCKFLIPVPAGTYSSLNMKLYKEKSGNVEPVVGGSDFSLASGKSFSVANKELKVLPTIIPHFPNYTMVIWDPSKTPDNGTYILAYDKGDGTAWVNGDDNLRETLPAEIVTLDHMLYDELTQDQPGILLDQADYETAAWKVQVNGSNIGATWSIETGRKGTLSATFLGFDDNGFIQLYVGGTNGTSNNIRYYSGAELDAGNFSLNPSTSDPIWDNGGFIYSTSGNTSRESNIKLFRLVLENTSTSAQ